MIYQSFNYNANIDYIISNFIREYDIKQANINILLESGLLSRQEYDFLKSQPKEVRQRTIGLKIRDDQRLIQAIQAGVKEAKFKLFKYNNIQEYEVLSIKNDAVFLINKIPEYVKFDNIEFVMKNIYTSFYRLDKIEVYYFNDKVKRLESFDIKGIGSESIDKHKGYFLDFMLEVMYRAENDNYGELILFIKDFYNEYINLKLDVNFYRNFDKDSDFIIKEKSMYDKIYTLKEACDDMKIYLNIACNANIIILLYKIISNHYMKK